MQIFKIYGTQKVSTGIFASKEHALAFAAKSEREVALKTGKACPPIEIIFISVEEVSQDIPFPEKENPEVASFIWREGSQVGQRKVVMERTTESILGQEEEVIVNCLGEIYKVLFRATDEVFVPEGLTEASQCYEPYWDYDHFKNIIQPVNYVKL